MKEKHLLLVGSLVAFAAGVSVTFVLLEPRADNLQGSLLPQNEEPPAPQSCAEHDECPAGQVCRLGTCAAAERRFCSQTFMLAESVEGRFIRYTLCENRCVRSGDSASCE